MANEFLGIDGFIKVVAAVAVLFMSPALVGLATGLGARYPRFTADNPSQVAGSYGGVAFMVAAVLYVILMMGLLGWGSSLHMWQVYRHRTLPPAQTLQMAAYFTTAAVMSLGLWRFGMRSGIRALEEMG